MARHVVGRVSDIPDGGRLLVDLQGHSVGIFHVRGRYYALLNRCPHMGAELCRGSILGRLDAAVPGEFSYDDSRSLLRCPWHGWEYDLETGQSYFDSRARSYPVDVEGGEALRPQVEDGSAAPIDEANHAQAAVGLPSARLQPGPYVAETYPIEIEDDYVVVTLPGPARR
ncbi:MAG: Rieske (2Fe-2S) protein [Solirubrobacterales bacterium]|nr:Rieske (2Fe-2S) protein [Solirubrobacterales bacterium]